MHINNLMSLNWAIFLLSLSTSSSYCEVGANVMERESRPEYK